MRALLYRSYGGPEVLEVGEGVTGVAVGDDVFGRGRNTMAELAVLDSWAPKAPQIDWAVAGAVGSVGETAERVLRLLDMQPGDTLFIDGGAGGGGGGPRPVAPPPRG